MDSLNKIPINRDFIIFQFLLHRHALSEIAGFFDFPESKGHRRRILDAYIHHNTMKRKVYITNRFSCLDNTSKFFDFWHE